MAKPLTLLVTASSVALLVLAGFSTSARACRRPAPRCYTKRVCYRTYYNQQHCTLRRVCRPYRPRPVSCWQKVCTYRYGQSHCSYQNVCRKPRPIRHFYY